MDFDTTNAWIFLSIALASRQGPAKIGEISSMADGINHAMPTEREIQFALWVLLGKQLVVKKPGNRYELTLDGQRLHEEASASSERLIDIWKYIEEKFSAK